MDVCIPNIGRRERAKRMRLGAAAGVVASIAGGGLIVAGPPWWARALVFVPAVISAYGVFQARENT
ncbi:MAG: hypothetical protein WCJ30_00500 [Deltaproteobacteria bacterium]